MAAGTTLWYERSEVMTDILAISSTPTENTQLRCPFSPTSSASLGPPIRPDLFTTLVNGAIDGGLSRNVF